MGLPSSNDLIKKKKKPSKVYPAVRKLISDVVNLKTHVNASSEKLFIEQMNIFGKFTSCL